MMNATAFLPKPSVRGMKILDKDKFAKLVQVPSIKMQSKKCGTFREHFKTKLLRLPKVKGIRSCNDNDQYKVMLLQPNNEMFDSELEWVSENGGVMATEDLQITYDHYSIHDILQAVLPIEETKDIPSSFEIVGHIAHVNLREEQLPYKELIGNVILDKQPGIETVVNKLANIDETFRFFKMEVLAGKPNMTTTIQENGCTFKFDFSKVYWNSRLHTEHRKIIDMLNPNDIVLDVFAGVGPFAVPACRKGCIVHANDLNPAAYEALISNGIRNKVKGLYSYCQDGREFIRTVVAKLILEYKGKTDYIVSHILMNLPMTAVEFLDVFRGLFTGLPLVLRSKVKLPKIHCYCFSKSVDDLEQDSVRMVEEHLGTQLQANTYDVRMVRNVAPNKRMTRVSFSLPSTIAYYQQEDGAGDTKNHFQQGLKRVLSSDRSDIAINIPKTVDELSSSSGVDYDCCEPPSAKKEKL